MARKKRIVAARTGGRSGPAIRRTRALPKLPARRRDGHKGDFGRVLVIGGSRGMIGAPALVANAALRSGAGLVTVACPKSIQQAVATLCPCATSIPLAETRNGLLDARRAFEDLRREGVFEEKTAPSVLAAGPGLGQGSREFSRGLMALIGAFGNGPRVPAVLDADVLNAMHRSSTESGTAWNTTPHYRTVITPHPGEMARLNGTSTELVQRDREGMAVRMAREMSRWESDPEHRVVVVLKGAGTVVTDGQAAYTNQSGNPGMATGGSGDVLTGVIAALIGQGFTTYEAAVLGVSLHGRAGDLAACALGQVSLIASDIIDYLPEAFRLCRSRRV